MKFIYQFYLPSIGIN